MIIKNAISARAPLRTPLEVKQQITLQKISPVERALEWFSARGQKFEATPLLRQITLATCYILYTGWPKINCTFPFA